MELTISGMVAFFVTLILGQITKKLGLVNKEDYYGKYYS